MLKVKYELRYILSLWFVILPKYISNLAYFLVQEMNPIWFGDNAFNQLQQLLATGDFSGVFFLVDENTHDKCLPYLLRSLEALPHFEVLEVEPGEDSKSPEVLIQLWMALSELKADRHSLLINVGGGVITDLGGFLAGTYLRGISFVNIPTSLLAMVDASMGGKTGVNLDHLKNRVGLFVNPLTTCIIPEFLETLPLREKRSGFAEMLKHGLIASSNYWDELTAFDIENDTPTEEMIAQSVSIKQEIVTEDFKETGIRKALNFGHTIGHAIETASLEHGAPLLHGEAIALGMMIELSLSEEFTGLDPKVAKDSQKQLRSIYNDVKVEFEPDYLIELMAMDKKNKNEEIRFSLISQIGQAVVDVNISSSAISKALLGLG